MRLILLTMLVALTGCETVEEDFEGRLVQVEVITVSDDCTPARFSGDAGLQFIGTRPDGGTVFTLSNAAVYGPLIDGGVLEAVIRQALPPVNMGRSNVGQNGEVACDGIFGDWRQIDTELNLQQDFPGFTDCVTGPPWLPERRCTVERTLKMTDVGTCRISCLRVTASTEVVCEC
ncbi:MAG: hypothetical protein ACO1OB_19770 [Archangium sp.]